MKPREGELSEYTETMLDDMARVAPDIAHVLRKYMPAPSDGIAFTPKTAVKTLMDYGRAYWGYWDVCKQSDFVSQTKKAVDWLNAVCTYIEQQEATE